MNRPPLPSTILLLTLGTLCSQAALAQLSDLSNQVQDRIDRTVEQQVDRAQTQADQVAQQASEQAVEQATQRSAEQALDQITQQASEQSVDQAVIRAADQATEQAGTLVGERVLENLPDPVERIEQRLPDLAERLQDQLPAAVGQGRARIEEQVQNGIGQALENSRGNGPLANLPERLNILDRAGNTLFVEIEIDPEMRALDLEWLMLLTPDQLQLLQAQAGELLEYQESSAPLDSLGGTLLRFRLPPGLDSQAAVDRLVPESLRDLIERNLIYSTQAQQIAPGQQLSLPLNAVCEEPLALGMIDSAIEIDHPAFAEIADTLVTRSFLRANLDQPSGHGTAVAGLLVGRGEALQPLLPGAKLYAASVVYAQDSYHRGATLEQLLTALNWLAQQDLRVINMSLAGPPSSLLELATEAIQRLDKLVVAAAGNDGPHAGPRYPAAYPGVIAATAVDVDQRIYPWANQGNHIDFAAPGVSVPTARAGGQFGPESGTSIATPVVAAFLACQLNQQGSTIASALEALRAAAVDLGDPGSDPVFGYGLLYP